MKKLIKKPRALVIPEKGFVWERKLVLKRLKPPPRGWPWRKFWRYLGAFAAIFGPAEVVREVGPGLPPEREHEWKKASQRELRI